MTKPADQSAPSPPQTVVPAAKAEDRIRHRIGSMLVEIEVLVDRVTESAAMVAELKQILATRDETIRRHELHIAVQSSEISVLKTKAKSTPKT